jgi:hypothetical protein
MGRTEFLTPTIRSEPRLESANLHESEMALFSECTQGCARKLDTADIVRDGDVSPPIQLRRRPGRKEEARERKPQAARQSGTRNPTTTGRVCP